MNQSESLIVSVDDQEIIVQTEEGHGVYAFADHGSIGLHDSIHEGARRCVAINVTASGWVDLTMPWTSMGRRSIADLQLAWKTGDFPASLHIELYGLIVEEPYTCLLYTSPSPRDRG